MFFNINLYIELAVKCNLIIVCSQRGRLWLAMHLVLWAHCDYFQGLHRTRNGFNLEQGPIPVEAGGTAFQCVLYIISIWKITDEVRSETNIAFHWGLQIYIAQPPEDLAFTFVRVSSITVTLHWTKYRNFKPLCSFFHRRAWSKFSGLRILTFTHSAYWLFILLPVSLIGE